MIDRETERLWDRETERQRDRETERQRDRETERQRDRETERQRDRKTKPKKWQKCLLDEIVILKDPHKEPLCFERLKSPIVWHYTFERTKKNIRIR